MELQKTPVYWEPGGNLDCLDGRNTVPGAPPMRFTDSHMHFWDQSVLQPYTWLHEVPAIAHAHTPATLAAEAGADLPDRIVFVECGAPWLAEVLWVERLAATEPRLRAIVAKIAINEGGTTTAAIAELRRHPLVRGVRHHFEHDAADYCARPEFITGVRQLAAADLSFDICCRHAQLPAVISLVRACPQVRFILDHGGKPGIRSGQLDPWREQLRTLAALPNLVCKLSGLVTEADHRTWQPEQLQPYLDHLLTTFGPSRLLFGGDWPVAKLASDYRRWLDLARQATASLTTAEQAAIFHENAGRIYRL